MKLSDDMVGELEAFLKADVSGKLRQEIVTSLAELQQKLTVAAHKLQSPKDFKTIEAANRATQSAMLVMMMTEGESFDQMERRAPWQGQT